MTVLTLDPVVAPDYWDIDDDEGLEHYYCACNPDIAICGVDITGAPDHTDIETLPEDDCVVCVDLLDLPCIRCRT